MNKKTMKFEIWSDGYFLEPLVIVIRVYPTRAKMLAGEAAWSKKYGHASVQCEKTMGICKSWVKIVFDEDAEKHVCQSDIFLNYKDLSDDRLFFEIISHEVSHAVLDYAGEVKREIPEFDPLELGEGLEVNEANEIFCNLIGRVTSCICAWINHWKCAA